MNIFRNILPGELAFDASLYSTVGFYMHNTLDVELVLLTENTTDWQNRLRLKISANSSPTDVNIHFDDFVNTLGQKYNNEKIKGLVFSVQGNYQSFQPFEISVSNAVFKTVITLNAPSFENVIVKKMYNYPNPCTAVTTLVLPKVTERANVKIIDMNGRIIKDKTYDSISYNNEIEVAFDNINLGIYFFIVTTKENETFKSKLIVLN